MCDVSGVRLDRGIAAVVVDCGLWVVVVSGVVVAVGVLLLLVRCRCRAEPCCCD